MHHKGSLGPGGHNPRGKQTAKRLTKMTGERIKTRLRTQRGRCPGAEDGAASQRAATPDVEQRSRDGH